MADAPPEKRPRPVTPPPSPVASAQLREDEPLYEGHFFNELVRLCKILNKCGHKEAQALMKEY